MTIKTNRDICKVIEAQFEKQGGTGITGEARYVKDGKAYYCAAGSLCTSDEPGYTSDNWPEIAESFSDIWIIHDDSLASAKRKGLDGIEFVSKEISYYYYARYGTEAYDFVMSRIKRSLSLEKEIPINAPGRIDNENFCFKMDEEL